MNPQARTGLVAAGIVGFLFMSVACAVGGYVYTHREGSAKDATGPKPLADRPVSDGSSSDDTAYILGHRWWKRAPSKKQLEALVAFTIELNPPNSVWVDDEGRYANSDQNFEVRRDVTWFMPKEFEGKKRYFWFICNWPTRPDRSAVLSRIRSNLDQIEYKDGPGR